jgi:sulfide:quinone oxidoreductase
VIVGGGVAALETLLGLRVLAGDRVEISLISAQSEFIYRPMTVAEAFGRGEADVYSLDEIVADQGGGELIIDALAEVGHGDRRVIVTETGRELAYDALVVAIGARTLESLPGALTFRGRDDVSELRSLLAGLSAGSIRSVALALPSTSMWPLPIYELALMTASHVVDTEGIDVSLVTPEQEPLELFGPLAARAVSPMLEANRVSLRLAAQPDRIADGSLVLADGSSIETDRVITLPLFEGPRVRGLPCDEQGFVPVDAHGRVSGLPDVYAAGDATSFPLKQGGIAAQQADAIVEVIAAQAGADLAPKPFKPVQRGLLLTGGNPVYLRSEPQQSGSRVADAIELRDVQGAMSTTAGALWWPPDKIAGRYLAPYLAATQGALPGGRDDARELALLLADCDARRGDYSSALAALDAAEALQGRLPHEYELKRFCASKT